MAQTLLKKGVMKALAIILASYLILFIPIAAISEEKQGPYKDIAIPHKVAECVADLPPAIGDLHAEALKYARIRPGEISSWKKNVKLAALLPRLQFGYERRLTDAVSVDIDDSVSVTGSGTTIGPTTSAWDRNLDRNHNIEITAVWYLDELLFNRDALSISSEARSQLAARGELFNEITESYYELKKLISIYFSRDPETEGMRGQLRLDIDRLIGRLDAVTGGWFGMRFNWKGADCG